jgi:hypothetical protein
MIKKILFKNLILLLICQLNANEIGATPSIAKLNETYRVYLNVEESRLLSQSLYSNYDGTLKSEFDIRVSTSTGTIKLESYDSKYWYKNFTVDSLETIYHTFYVYRNNSYYNSLGGISIKVSNNSNAIAELKGIFDGAGSLVSPNESCYGCNEDIAKMHPHYEASSIVVFQWLYDNLSCKEVDITADRMIETIIKAKVWNEHSTQKSFKVTLGTNPVTLKKPSEEDWTTFAITSTKPVNSSILIKAECKGYDEPFYSGSAISYDKNLVELNNNYFWMGTGSIISSATERGVNAYGVQRDLAITSNSKNSLTSFQWYASDDCPKLKILDRNNANVNIDGIYIKGWSSSTWSSNQCSVLPCILNTPNGLDSYYIIKVKSKKNSIPSGKLGAICIE